jgi:hypothetical protein
MRTIVILAAAWLAGCSTLMPGMPVEVEIPVPVPCLTAAQLPQRPAVTSNEDLKAMSDRNLLLRIAGEREALAAYVSEAHPLLEACTKP